MGLLQNIKILSGKKPPTDTPKPTQVVGKKILIVEDDTSLATVLGEKLTQEGFVVSKAGNGEEGLKMAQNVDPNLIILDLLMPVMGGQAMLHRLRAMQKFKHLPVMVLTNAGDVDNLQEAHFQNAYFFIKSNVTLEEIVKSVKHLA